MNSLKKIYLNKFPFTLTYSSGFSNALYKWFIKSISKAIPIKRISNILREIYEDYYYERQNEYVDYWFSEGVDPTWMASFPGFEQLSLAQDHREIMRQMFIYDYMKKQKYFDYLWATTFHSGRIAADHTFKTAKKLKLNINGDCIQPYSCLYDIHSENGVLLVQFCASSAFEHVQHLHAEIQKKGKVCMLVLDKCCENENEIARVHGHGCEIKLNTLYICII